MSYRLGMLGFSAFAKEKGDGGQGNNGILDILAAAKWLKNEAASFGGDPASITAFGESSGATDAQVRITYKDPSRSRSCEFLM